MISLRLFFSITTMSFEVLAWISFRHSWLELNSKRVGIPGVRKLSELGACKLSRANLQSRTGS